MAELEANAEPVEMEKIDRDSLDVDLMDSDAAGNDLASVLDEIEIDDEQVVRVIILMDEQSIIEENAAATPSAASLEEAEQLENEQDSVISVIENEVLGEPLAVSYQYTWLLNGIAAQIPYGKIRQIEQLDGVRKVILQPVYQPLSADTGETTTTDDESGIMPITNTEGGMIGRDDAWSAGYKGEGMKIAVIDTGIDDDHPSFGPLAEDVYAAYSGSYRSISPISAMMPAE